METIKIAKKSCKKCFFFTWQGNYQEDFCGLYMKHTVTDIKDSKPKPKFCLATEVKIEQLQTNHNAPKS